MTCAITTGFTIPCSDTVGGLKRVLFANLADVTQPLTATAGNITAITMVASAKFLAVPLPNKNKDYFKETWQKSNENGTLFWMQELQVTLRQLSATTRTELMNYAAGRLIAIVETNNGEYWMLGEVRGLELEPSEGNTGAAKGDFNGYVLKFSGEETAPAQTVESSIIAALLS